MAGQNTPAAAPDRAAIRQQRADEASRALQRKAEDLLGRAVVDLMRREPFFGHVIAGLPRYFTDEIDTMAVGLRGGAVQLLVNPRFLVSGVTRTEHRAAVLKHEILHVVLKHIFRATPKADPLLWNIAADLVVNQLVAPLELPEGAVTLQSFPELGLPRDATVERYHALLSRANRRASTADAAANPGPAPQQTHNATESEPQHAENGSPADSQTPDTGDEDAASRPQLQQTAETLARLRESNGASDHSLWADGADKTVGGQPAGGAFPAPLAKALETAMEDRLLQAHQRTRAARGTVPAWLDRWLAEIAEARKARVDWRRVLRIFASSSKRTRIVLTQRRESRRFEPIEGVKRYAGLKVKRYQRMAVVIDTSGSVGQEELAVFFAEIQGIHRAGCEIVIVECDARIGRVWTFDGRIPTKVTGGGGTSFDPPMHWLRNPRHGPFDACVYLTDGEAPAPTVRPPCPVLWAICRGDGSHLPGRVVVVE